MTCSAHLICMSCAFSMGLLHWNLCKHCVLYVIQLVAVYNYWAILKCPLPLLQELEKQRFSSRPIFRPDPISLTAFSLVVKNYQKLAFPVSNGLLRTVSTGAGCRGADVFFDCGVLHLRVPGAGVLTSFLTAAYYIYGCRVPGRWGHFLLSSLGCNSFEFGLQFFRVWVVIEFSQLWFAGLGSGPHNGGRNSWLHLWVLGACACLVFEGEFLNMAFCCGCNMLRLCLISSAAQGLGVLARKWL